jgi:hypothetical protein
MTGIVIVAREPGKQASVYFYTINIGSDAPLCIHLFSHHGLESSLRGPNRKAIHQVLTDYSNKETVLIALTLQGSAEDNHQVYRSIETDPNDQHRPIALGEPDILGEPPQLNESEPAPKEKPMPTKETKKLEVIVVSHQKRRYKCWHYKVKLDENGELSEATLLRTTNLKYLQNEPCHAVIQKNSEKLFAISSLENTKNWDLVYNNIITTTESGQTKLVSLGPSTAAANGFVIVPKAACRLTGKTPPATPHIKEQETQEPCDGWVLC